MRPFRHFCAGLIVGGLLVASGCDGTGPPVGGSVRGTRGADPPGQVALQPAPVLPVPSSAGAGRRGRMGQIPVAMPSVGGAEQPSGAAGTPPEAAEAAPTDSLGDALRTRFGTPTDCISAETRENLTGTLNLNVSVRVMPSGRVMSASVSGSGLSPEDLACMRGRAEALRLPGPIENAPRTVATTVSYEISGTPPTTIDPEPSPPHNLGPGAVGAGSALPPGGTETERPRGFVAPSSTLPAVTE